MTKANFSIFHTSQGILLQSYETMIAMITRDGRTILNDYRYSVTTSRHTNQFLGWYHGSREGAKMVSPSTMEKVAFAAMSNTPIENVLQEGN